MSPITKSSYAVFKDEYVWDFNLSDFFTHENIRVDGMTTDSLPDARHIAEKENAMLVVVDMEITPRILSWPSEAH
jgi:hypothetical protein